MSSSPLDLPRLACLIILIAVPVSGFGQEQLLHDRWVAVQTEHFSIISQVSARQTTRFADALETWRQLAAYVIQDESPFPPARVPNYVYLFDDSESLQHFTVGDATAFFHPTPRANFMALVANDEESFSIATHHYVHFLVRNFSDLRLPRWYEEGLSGYLARVQINRGRAQFERFSREDNDLTLALSETLSMDRLLYRDDALASPRLVLIANLKSETLLHYFLHGYEEEGFSDHRLALQNYLGLLLDGRNSRFAYDQAFDLTTVQLDADFHNYLLQSSRPRGNIEYGVLSENPDYSASEIESGRLAVLFAELALNSGRMQNAQLFFQAALDSGTEIARSYSGMGDALRMQDLEGIDQTIAHYFEQAVAISTDDPDILMDYGEYWEAELSNCEKTYPADQRGLILADIRHHFERTVVLVPDNPEANLAMAQLYLLEGQNWQAGLDYQRRAFALLPADTFIMEQAIKYSIAADDYDEAERLITKMAQPIHFWGEPGIVTDLRKRLLSKRRNEPYDACAED